MEIDFDTSGNHADDCIFVDLFQKLLETRYECSSGSGVHQQIYQKTAPNYPVCCYEIRLGRPVHSTVVHQSHPSRIVYSRTTLEHPTSRNQSIEN